VKAFRAIDELLDTRRLHGRNAAYGELEQRLEMLEVVFEKLELEAIGKPIDGPRYRVRLIAAHHQAARLPLSNK
jgi:hypothetical protein